MHYRFLLPPRDREMAKRTPRVISNVDDLDIKIIRSKRRKKTVSAELVNWYTLQVRAPETMSDRDLEPLIADLARKVLAKRHKMRDFSSDDALEKRAQYWNERLFKGKLKWRSVRFVGNQSKRFGSCSPQRGTIRISDRLADVPQFVLDYVIVHELAHLVEANHSKAFWSLVYQYPLVERARGYLMALQFEEEDLRH